jgi:hypothetical protein
MEENKKPNVVGAVEHMARLHAMEGNVYPQPAAGRNGEHMDIISFALNAGEIFNAVEQIMKADKYDEFAFGLDRKTLPDQGIDSKYTDVYTIFHHIGNGMWEYFILPYSKEEVGALQPASYFWSNAMDDERLSRNII